MDVATAQALIRFGLGPRAGEAPPGDPQAWLQSQVRNPDPARFLGLPSVGDAAQAYLDDRANRPPPGQSESRRLYMADARAQFAQALTTEAPFRERLVMFWANHFTVSLRAARVAAVAGNFVRTAIRPHVTGRFHDMLLAVMRHPAMLVYLDNIGSAGPHSRAGLRRDIGLNENLARESLELHTVSPAAGYSQADVTSYAAILTGWSIDLRRPDPGFVFRPNMHEPGPKTLMGREFPEGEAGGVAALAFLAAHPATRSHLATKLVRHFVADDPPPGAVARIAAVLTETDGDLGAAALALVALPEAWKPLGKLRSPQDFMLAALRAANLPDDNQPDPVGVAAALGQAQWGAPFPIGWPDTAAEWGGPEAILRRVDWAYSVSGRMNALDPDAIASTALGPLLRPATQQAMQHAGSRRDAVALLFASPEFQRR